MTSQGSPLPGLHRALASRNVLLTLATAAELPHATIALAALSALASGRVESGSHALLAILDSHGLDEVSGILEAWFEPRSGS